MRCGPSGIPCHPHGPRNGAEGAFPIDVDPEMAFREHRARGTAVMSRHAAPQSSKAGNIPFKPITHHRCTPMPATPIAEVRAAPARCMSTPRMDPREYAGMVSGPPPVNPPGCTIFWCKERLTKEDRGQDHPPPDPRCRRAPGHQGPPGGPPGPQGQQHAVPTQATQRGIRSRRWIPS